MCIYGGGRNWLPSVSTPPFFCLPFISAFLLHMELQVLINECSITGALSKSLKSTYFICLLFGTSIWTEGKFRIVDPHRAWVASTIKRSKALDVSWPCGSLTGCVVLLHLTGYPDMPHSPPEINRRSMGTGQYSLCLHQTNSVWNPLMLAAELNYYSWIGVSNEYY